MQLNINLASAPFRNRTPFWLAVALAFLLTVVAGVAVVARSGAIDAEVERLNDEVADQDKEIAELETRLGELKRSEESAVLTVADRAALDEARSLVDRKSLSWSRLLVELEHYVPSRSRLNSISVGGVQGGGEQRVVKMKLELEGLDQREVAEMLLSFDRSGGRFRAEPVSITPTEQQPRVQYVLDVEYRPGIAAGAPLPPAATVLTPNQTSSAGAQEDDE